MSLRINSSLSLMATRQLDRVNKAIARSIDRLASGSRIATPLDGASEMARGTQLSAQFRAINQAIRNVNDGIGILTTADGAMDTLTSLLQRMRELSIQSANGTLGSNDRTYLSNEFEELVAEFARTINSTNFNGKQLFSGDFDNLNIQLGSSPTDRINLSMERVNSADYFEDGYSFVGNGTFNAGTTINDGISGGYSNHFVLTADLNGDGRDDIIRTDNSGGSLVSVFYSTGQGTFSARQTLAISGNFFSGDVGDINGDGRIDFVMNNSGPHTVVVAINNGGGSFSISGTWAVAGNPNDVKLGDLNGDGSLDFVTGGGSSIGSRTGNGSGLFGNAYSVSVTGGSNQVELGDFDEDGNLDVISLNIGSTSVSIGLGNGDGSFQTITTIGTTGTGPNSMKVDDFNGDGHMDIAVAETTANTIGFFFGNGDGTFASRTTISATGAPVGLGKGDFNGDGAIDLFYGSSTSGFMSVLLNNGSGSFTQATTYTTSNVVDSEVGDFSGDGVDDIVWISNSAPYNANTLIAQSSYVLTDPMKIDTQERAEDMLDRIDDNLDQILSYRAQIGAQISRLTSSESVLSVTRENIAKAKSELMDLDYASEMAEFARLQILQQAGVSVLAQAHISSKLTLELLKNIKEMRP